MRVNNRVIIVTGASSGIGRACVCDLVANGAKVVLASRNAKSLCDLTEQIDPLKQRTLVVPTDVTIEDDCRQLIETTLQHFGQIDILINNAGLSMRANFSDVDIAVLKKLMDVNFWGTVFCTKYALPHILKSKGSIVGITSIAGFIGLPGRTGYSASKFAMLGFLETVRNENIGHGLHVLIIAPGFTASNIRRAALTADGTPQGTTPREETHMMTAQKVAIAIRHGIERRKNKVVLTFRNGKLALFVNKWFPSFIAKVAYNDMRNEPNSPIQK